MCEEIESDMYVLAGNWGCGYIRFYLPCVRSTLPRLVDLGVWEQRGIIQGDEGIVHYGAGRLGMGVATLGAGFAQFVRGKGCTSCLRGGRSQRARLILDQRMVHIHTYISTHVLSRLKGLQDMSLMRRDENIGRRRRRKEMVHILRFYAPGAQS